MNASLEPLFSRRSRAPLTGPAPTNDDLGTIFAAAVAVPDHGRLQPWRFVLIQDQARAAFGGVLAAAAAETYPAMTADDLAQVENKAFAAPCMVVVIAAPRIAKIPEWEQLASAACAAHAITLAAEALGYGSAWKSASAWQADAFRKGLRMQPSEYVLGWVLLGTVAEPSQALATRVVPRLASLVSVLDAGGELSPFANHMEVA